MTMTGCSTFTSDEQCEVRARSKRMNKTTPLVPKIEAVYFLAHGTDSDERCEVPAPSKTMAKTTPWAPKIENFHFLAHGSESYDLNSLTDYEPILKLNKVDTVITKLSDL